MLSHSGDHLSSIICRRIMLLLDPSSEGKRTPLLNRHPKRVLPIPRWLVLASSTASESRHGVNSPNYGLAVKDQNER